MIDIDEFSFVHDDETMKNELTFNTDILSKLKQKCCRKNRNDDVKSLKM